MRAMIFPCLFLSFLGTKAFAFEEKPKQPRTPASLYPDAPAPESMAFYPKESAYRHWQNLAMDRGGFFKPRVAYSLNGLYYMYNGMEYPFMNSRRGDFMPNNLGFQSFYPTPHESPEPPRAKENK
ncbi:MAG: hypothetical protein EXR99_08060 [Gemmataceae bacterium]|nr:hypothetical protein [Gemmataceae bacterium]